MAEQLHPITPPPELVQQWASEFYGTTITPGEAAIDIATRAAQWGANQELEACVNWLDDTDCEDPQEASLRLRWHRRPKPPSLKEQALLQLDTLNADLAMHGRGCDLSQIRRALEALDD